MESMDNDVDEGTEVKTGIELKLDAALRVNFASAQNDIPVIKDLKLINHDEEPVMDATVALRIEPSVIQPKRWAVDRVTSELGLRDLSTPLDNERLRGLNETEVGEIILAVMVNGETKIEERRRIELLARDHWGGLQDMDRLLAAFVSPNDAAVAEILKKASELLERKGHEGSMEGYQSDNPQRVYMIAAAIWSAVTGMNLTYANPPASFEDAGQKVRDPQKIRSEGLATCLDLSLLLAAAWEAAGLNPVVLFSDGHAFAGVWIVKKDFGQVTEPDVVSIRKAAQAREFIPVETTLVAKRPTVGFNEAWEAGRAHLSEEGEDAFIVAVDISRSRSARIRPLAHHRTGDGQGSEQGVAAPAQLPQPMDLGLLPEEIVDPVPDSPRGRIERWQSKLLDLSLRNRLLNFRETKQTIQCMVPDVGRLEDALANGESFKAYPLKEDDPIGERRVAPEEQKRIIDSAVSDAFARGQITVPIDKREMDSRLLVLYRKAKSDLQEGGTNTLYLAAGFLRWQRENENQKYRAPLLLIPVKLTRKSARSEFQIQHHEDEVRFNSTLIEFLKRDFSLSLSELEGELPCDGSGVDLPKVFSLLRSRVRDIAGFEIVEETAISTFSFSKYLMWKDLVDRTDQLRTNRLVAHLVDNPEKKFGEGQPEPYDPKELDRRVIPKDLRIPLPADSSQLAAIVEAAGGRDFVLIGPPGTGKSQTIANIICQCISLGKTVLFVAEKAAALDVVHRRLEAHGIGDAVLELHSNKTDRKRVLAQLGRGWDRIAENTGDTWVEVNEKLRVARDQLNAYVSELHATGTQGFSIFDAIGWVAPAKDGLRLEFANKDAHDAESFRHLAEVADRLSRTYEMTSGGPSFPIIGSADWSFEWEAAILDKAEMLGRAVERASKAAAEISKILALKPDRDVLPERRALLRNLAKRVDASAADLTKVPHMPEAQLRDHIKRLKSDLSEIAKYKRDAAASYPEAQVDRMPIDQMDADWRKANAGFWPFSAMARSKVRKLMQTYADSGSAAPETDIPALIGLKSKLDSLRENPTLGVAGNTRSGERAERVVTQANDLRRALAEIQVSALDTVAFGAAKAEFEAVPSGPLRAALEEWAAASAALTEAQGDFEMAGGTDTTEAALSNTKSDVRTLISERARILDWTKWLGARREADAKGLEKLANLIEECGAGQDAALEFKRAYARWWLPIALDASDELRKFAHWEHEDLIKTFRDLDTEASNMAPAELMARIRHGLPARDGVPRNSELGLLRHQLGLKRPSMAIRSLLENLPETFPKLAPCVLMSPLSIAQYFPAGQATFDVVIFDEASQITTWDAIGAIARGKQSIIVGDPKQLPPTNFFGRSEESDEDGGDFLLGEMPSILDEVTASGVPTRRLDWHYRSRDEALIAFSNHFYYDDRLVTFPAPSTGSEALQFHKIEGVYARGAGRTNAREAKAIAGMVRLKLKSWLEWPEEKRYTLGVITFNSQQQALILDLLDDVRRTDPELEWFFSDDREEPVIVKNLENIQGDERDVMMFSITFAPDAAGKFTMNFGALNGEGGEKCLNVAVTRARRELHVFSSITHEQIDLSRTRAKGVRDLKTFLDYAKRGSVALPAREEGSLGPAESPFEEAVADAFRTKGWEVRTQIGVSGFRIDLGVVNPDRAGAYLVGIECDGATYHRSATARDRDKVRQAVLEGLGWNILRIWSTDWFRSPGEVIKRLHGRLEEILEADRVSRDEEKTEVAEEKVLALPSPDPCQTESDEEERPETEAEVSEIPSFARMTSSSRPSERTKPDPDRFFETRYLPTLRGIIEAIVREKGPISIAVLAREIARAHGWQRTGKRILERVRKAMDGTTIRREFGREFVWKVGDDRDKVPYRGLDERSVADISRAEIATVLDELGDDIQHSDDPEFDLARSLGIQRLSSSARLYLGKVLGWYRNSKG